MFINLSSSSRKYKKQAVDILFEASKSITLKSWTTIGSARKEIKECCNKNYITCGLVENGELIGWAGLRLMYDNVTWELHPIMVKPPHQRNGAGSKLLAEIERIAKMMMTLSILGDKSRGANFKDV